MTEDEFIGSIDWTFNFKASIEPDFNEITKVGSSLSDNAALMVAFVLAKGEGSIDIRLKFLKRLKKKRPTPIMLASFPLVEAIIKDKDPKPDDIEYLLELSRKTPGSYNALNIVYLADETKEDSFALIYKQWKAILKPPNKPLKRDAAKPRRAS
jgi:hypothetical protein